MPRPNYAAASENGADRMRLAGSAAADFLGE